MKYLLTAFFSGMAVTVVELAASRLIAPYFGASLFVWTNVIGIILVGLALGYTFGGRLADRSADDRTLYRILGIAAILVALTPFAVRPIAGFFVVGSGSIQLLPFYLVFGSFMATVLLFLVPVSLLGVTSPFLIAMLKRSSEKGVGTVSGKIFAWSTTGSILGIFMTGLLLIPIFGTRRTILGAAAILALLAIVGERRIWKLVSFAFILALLAIPPSAFGPLRASPGLLFEEESPYQYVRVNAVGDERYLIFNEGTGVQSVYNPKTIETLYYYDFMSTVPLLAHDGHMEMLMIGLGGGTLPRNFSVLYADRSYHIDGVEIDPVVVDVARQYFGMPEDRIDVHVADGRMFLRATEKQYDLIFLDAYAQQLYIPWQLSTVEFFSDVRDHLAPGGLLAFNVAALDTDSVLFQAFLATVHHVFPYTGYVNIPDSTNSIVFAANEKPDLARFVREGPHPFLRERGVVMRDAMVDALSPRGLVMTDDRAPVELLTDVAFTERVLGL